MPTGNNQFKDRLFSFIFGSVEHAEWTLSLYNAVNGTHYDDPAAIEFTTIRETLYLGMRNDVSFLISSLMNLYEQQSTFNPNMPVRMLQYAGNMFEQFIVRNNKNKYGKRLVRLPVPKLVVFYNGTDERDEAETLTLADAFPPETREQSDIDVRVRMLNVNAGKNPGLMEACKPLAEYSWIVAAIRENEKELAGQVKPDKLLETAIDRTIDRISNDFLTKPYLEAHRAEVKGMLLTEYDEVKAMELFKEEGREEGREEGLVEGLTKGRAEGRLEGRAEGRLEGRAEGEDRFARLIDRLLGLNRFSDVERAARDAIYREKLYGEFQIG